MFAISFEIYLPPSSVKGIYMSLIVTSLAEISDLFELAEKLGRFAQLDCFLACYYASCYASESSFLKFST